MTQLEFWGCAFISFGLPLAMFIFTIAKDPLRIIVFVARCLVYFRIILHVLCRFTIPDYFLGLYEYFCCGDVQPRNMLFQY